MNNLKQLTLNVVVATFNRADLLRRTLASFARAEVPPNLAITVTVADNNSTDDTARAVSEAQAEFGAIKLQYIFEPRQGKSFALNRALAESHQDLIGFIDDDEEIAANWFVEIARMFGTRWTEIDFAGGKVLPRWENSNALPVWATPNFPGIAWRDYGDAEWFYNRETAILSGGHAIIKRSVFDETGFYSENIGPAGKNLLGCEDDVMFDKLLAAGKTGVYNPRLVIFHFVPEYRLTKNYFRQWCCGNGASQQLMDVYYKPFDGARVFGVPRFMYRAALESLWRSVKSTAGGNRAAFLNEVGLLVFLGYFHERNLKNSKLAEPLRRLAARFAPSVAR